MDYSEYDGRIVMIDFYKIVNILDKKCMFSHYPHYSGKFDKRERFVKEIRELDKLFKKEKCYVHYHGHIHTQKITFPNINISIDNLQDFGPVKFEDISK